MISSSNSFETYLFSYSHNGKRWEFEVKATSLDDAKRRLAKISMANYDGVLKASIPVPGGRFVNWLKDLIQ